MADDAPHLGGGRRGGEPSAASGPLEDRIGIIQGRLVASATGELQCSPGPKWREEFAIAGTLGLNHIELIAERVVDPGNPIWSAAGRRELVAVAEAAGISLACLGVDETLNIRFDDADFARDLAGRFAPVISELGTRIVVLPLLDASDLTVLDWSCAVESLRIFADEIASLGGRVALEISSVPATEGRRLLDATAHPNVAVCYDVGNSAAFGFDSPAELRVYGDRVWHVHAKDKNLAGQNVRFGTGEVPFAQVLAELTEQGFDGLVTMEATRGENPVVTAAEHRAFLLSLQESARQTPPDAK